MYFDIFDNLIRITGKIVNETPIAIRAGKVTEGPIENPIVRLNGIPYIPGSSLKGVLRSESERYARSIGEKVCDILNPKGENGELKWKEEKGENYEPCIICKIFGGPTIFSRVRFFDCFPSDGKFSTSLIQRVSINRITEAASPGRLFEVEFIEPGTNLDFKLEIENLTDKDQIEGKILKFILNQLIAGNISIGGMKSVGFGKIRLKDINIKKYKLENGEIKEYDITNSFLGALLK
jgi:CRISPR-associated RAMP protein (TIGR02581 family)